jgi:hypothetical protein
MVVLSVARTPNTATTLLSFMMNLFLVGLSNEKRLAVTFSLNVFQSREISGRSREENRLFEKMLWLTKIAPF